MPVLRATKCWQTFLFTKFVFEIFLLHISFGLPGPLRTANELKIALPTANNQQDATALTENAINWPKRPTNIKICFRIFPNFPQKRNG